MTKEDKDYISCAYMLEARSTNDIYDLIRDLEDEADEYRVHIESLEHDISDLRKYIKEERE